LKLEENNAYDEKKSVYALIYNSMKEEGRRKKEKSGSKETQSTRTSK
jgi:hypothetical protein